MAHLNRVRESGPMKSVHLGTTGILEVLSAGAPQGVRGAPSPLPPLSFGEAMKPGRSNMAAFPRTLMLARDSKEKLLIRGCLEESDLGCSGLENAYLCFVWA